MKNIIHKFYGLLAIVGIIIILTLYFQFNYFNRVLLEGTQLHAISSRDAIGEEISSSLLAYGQVIADTSNYIELEKWDRDELLGYMQSLMKENPHFSSIYFGSKDNLMINGSGWVPPVTFDLRTRPWYIKAEKEKKLVFSEAFLNASEDKMIITIAKPVYDSNNDLIGVVSGDVAIDEILSIVEGKKLMGKGYSFLIDGKGNILANPQIENNLRSPLKNITDVTEEISQYLSQSEPGIKRVNLGGNEGYLAYQSIKNTDWRIASFIPLKELMSKNTYFLLGFIITLITTLGTFVIFLMILSRYHIKPMLELDRDIISINMKKDMSYRLPAKEKELFYGLRKSINSVLSKTEELFRKLEIEEEKLTENNFELEAYVQQLLASEEEVKTQYDKIIESDRNLSISEEKYKTLIKQMHQGLALHEVILNEQDEVIDYRFLEVNESYEKLTGLKKEDLLGKTVLEVLPNTESYWIETYGHVAKTGEPLCFESFSKELNRYYEVIAYRTKPLQFAVIFSDITERRLAEELIKTSEYNFRMLFEGASDSIILIEDSKIIDCNMALIKLLGYESKEDVIGKAPWDISPDKQPDGSISKNKVEEIFNSTQKDSNTKFEWWHNKIDGTLIAVEIMLTEIVLDGKRVFHALLRDIGERKEFEKKLEYLSYHDQLTGLYNRRFFEEELIRLDVKRNLPMTIVLGDVNGLKLINDSFGHSIGDELLKKAAEAIKQGCREDDIVARLGGDEFIILLPKTDAFQTEQIIKRIKAEAANNNVGSIDLSISFGYQTKQDEEEIVSDVFKKAEDYMYREKLFESPSMRGKTIKAIINTLHEKNEREELHSQRVSELCKNIGKAIGLPEREIQELKTAGLLHDIGKIAIDENILNKPGKLTENEWQEIRQHPEKGYRILSTVNEMSEIADHILFHHERWDGKGYPKGLKGKEIPLQSRILSVADAYDAMTTERSYCKSKGEKSAIEELQKSAATQFDPELITIFVEKVLKNAYL
jgi:diguanylate cyclase (GGDEF)-like protein/PAS domain S-box-containing protein